MKNAIVILGNGYDLIHNSKTMYRDFIAQSEKNNNRWIKYFKTKVELEGWVDVENEFLRILKEFVIFEENYQELGCCKEMLKGCKSFWKFSNPMEIPIDRVGFNINDYLIKHEDFIKDFEEVKNLLQDYIKDEVSNNKTYGENKEIKDVLSAYDNVIVLNFNYTNTLWKYNKNTHNIFIHGDVDSEIILGHNNIENIYFSRIHKKTQQLSGECNYKSDFINISMQIEVNIIERMALYASSGIDYKPTEDETTSYDFIVLGHSIDTNDHGVLSWVYNTVLSSKYQIEDKLKLFYYKNDYNCDKHSRIYSIVKFFTNNFDLDLPMDNEGNNGQREYKRLQEKNLIEHIELKEMPNDQQREEEK